MCWQHIYPINDKREHDINTLYCDCEPRIDWENNMVIHNAWDMREIEEYLQGE